MIKSIVQVSIYLKGQNLNIDQATRLFGVGPTRVHMKGEKKVPGNPNSAVYLTNIWVLSKKMDSDDVNSALNGLFAKPFKLGNWLSELMVDNAYVDVFLANTVEVEDMSESIKFTLDEGVISFLVNLGMPVHFSVCNVAKD
jgi:hypothetical protein